MKALNSLPSDYTPIMSVDMQKDKKTAIVINAVYLLLMAVMIVPVCFLVPFSLLLQNYVGLFVLLLSVVLYMILHELTHAAVMKLFGVKKVNFGFTGMYAYAGCNFYFDRKSYVMIALAPVILFAIVFGAVNYFVPPSWFWVIYLLQVFNISGAAGDFYVVWKFSRLPRDILVHDSGITMTVFSKKDKA